MKFAANHEMKQTATANGTLPEHPVAVGKLVLPER